MSHDCETTMRLTTGRLRGAAMALLTVAALAGCGDFSGGAASAPTSVVGSGAPPGPVAGANPQVDIEAFDTTVYPLLTANCAGTCHVIGGTSGTPFISDPVLDTAYRAVVDNQKVNLAVPDSSRLVRRLVADFHHCWSNCMQDGAEMQAAIAVWAQMVVDAGGGTQVGGITSGTRQLANGIEDVGSERYSGSLIALWDFKEGSGPVAHDTSGVAPAMDLSILNADWMTSYGLSFENGKAQASPDTARKLYERIAAPGSGTQQYSVEGWVIPANTDQDGPARIISYSRNPNNRNFALGQVLYTYDFRNRTIDTEINNNGTPSLRTYDGDEDLQATLQHVVITYDEFRGRRIFVNGVWTGDLDEVGISRLWNWNEDYTFVLGNEFTADRPWEGKIQLVAIYDRALTEAQIRQNFDAGVGKRLIMRFDVAQWLGGGSYVEFNVSEFDAYSYLFCSPSLVTSNPNGVRVANMRIAVNGLAPVSGQAFVNLDAMVTQSKQLLSGTCSIVPKDKGPLQDVFALEFEMLGGFEDPIVVTLPPTAPPAVFPGVLPVEGIRDFSRVNESMAAVTGVDPRTAAVRNTFAELEQQLPGGTDLRAFSSSNQMGIAKLSLEYCDQLVETPALRDAFFGTAFDFTADATVAFSPAMRAELTQRLTDGMLGSGLALQPDATEVATVLNQLFDELTMNCTPATCGADRTRTVVKAACAAVLGSAAVSIH